MNHLIGYTRKYPRELIRKLSKVFWLKTSNREKYPKLWNKYKEKYDIVGDMIC